MVSSPSTNQKHFPHGAAMPHVVTGDIDAGSKKLEAPTFSAVSSRKAKDVERVGAITEWETPYNRPAFETPENIQYTRLATQYLQQGRIEDAERLYKQALVVAERTFPKGDSAIFRAIEDLSAFYYGHEKYKEAEPLVARLLTMRSEKLACDDWLLIRTIDQLADIYEKCGEPQQGQALYKLLIAQQEETLGRNSTILAFTLSRLADSYIRHNYTSAAESLLQSILEIHESVYGRSSLEVSTPLMDLSKIYQKLGRYDKAAEMLERLLHVLESIHGDNGLAVASCLLRLADLLSEIDLVEQADPLYRRAQEIYRLSYGESSAIHSVFRKKLERTTSTTLSRLSKDKPVEQEECSRFPAIRITLDDLLPSRLETGQINRCLNHKIFDEIQDEKSLGSDSILDSLFGSTAETAFAELPKSVDCTKTLELELPYKDKHDPNSTLILPLPQFESAEIAIEFAPPVVTNTVEIVSMQWEPTEASRSETGTSWSFEIEEKEIPTLEFPKPDTIPTLELPLPGVSSERKPLNQRKTVPLPKIGEAAVQERRSAQFRDTVREPVLSPEGMTGRKTVSQILSPVMQPNRGK